MTEKKIAFSAKHTKEKINALKAHGILLKDAQDSVFRERTEVVRMSKDAIHIAFAEHILSIRPSTQSWGNTDGTKPEEMRSQASEVPVLQRFVWDPRLRKDNFFTQSNLQGKME